MLLKCDTSGTLMRLNSKRKYSFVIKGAASGEGKNGFFGSHTER